MQGFETASLANDACGVPLPWLSTSPWLAFDGKLFQLKLKMTGCVQSLAELCDDHLESVLKFERLKKAILEDVEPFLLPDPMAFRNNFDLGGPVGGGYGGIPLPLLQSVNSGGLLGASQDYYGAPPGRAAGPPYIGGNHNVKNIRGGPLNNRVGINPLMRPGLNPIAAAAAAASVQQQKGHHLKVGGVVVGSWGSGYGRHPPTQAAELAHLSTRYNQVGRGRNASQMLSNRLTRMQLEMQLPHIPQYGPQAGFGGMSAQLNRAGFNTRGLGGGFGATAGLGGGYGGGGWLGRSMKAGLGGGIARKGKNNKQAAGLKKQQQQQNAKKKTNQKKKEGKKTSAGTTKNDEVESLGQELTTVLRVIGESDENEKDLHNG